MFVCVCVCLPASIRQRSLYTHTHTHKLPETYLDCIYYIKYTYIYYIHCKMLIYNPRQCVWVRVCVCKINGIQHVYLNIYIFRVGLVFVTNQAKPSPTGLKPHQARSHPPPTLDLHLVLPPKVSKSLGKINRRIQQFLHNVLGQAFVLKSVIFI